VSGLVREHPVLLLAVVVVLPALGLVRGRAMTEPRTPRREPIDLFWLALIASLAQIALAFV
jgi:hypothetical protein